MTKNIDITIELVSAHVWHQLRNMTETTTTPTTHLKDAILTMMHNRHVGITPELSRLLADVILHPGSQLKNGGPWSIVLERLMKELKLGNRRFGMVFQANAPFTIMRIAMPVVEQACYEMGKSYLFCEDNLVNMIDKQTYEDYATELSNQIEQLAQQDDYYSLFWKECALSLTNYSRHISTKINTFSIPKTNLASFSFFLNLEPDIPEKKQTVRYLRELPVLHKHRKIEKLKEEGIEGIRVTKEAESINDILLSEFINPELIFLDRLINTGYLAFKREPKREKLKDALIVAIIPWDVKHSLKIDMIKTCWFDCMMRLSILLRERKLQRSEFLWIEGDQFENARSDSFSLNNLYQTKLKDKPDSSFKNIFLTALGWLPFYFDMFSRYVNVKKQSDEAVIPERLDSIIQWATNSWKNLTSQSSNPSMDYIDVSEFSFIHIMLMLPENERNEDLSKDTFLGSLSKQFKLSLSSGRNVSTTWIPEKVDDIEKWYYDAIKRKKSEIFSTELEDISIQQITGSIISAWLTQLKSEIWSI